VFTIVICPNCEKNTPEGKFCEYCGASLQSTQTFTQPPARQTAVQQPASVKTQKNAIGAAIGSALWCGFGQTYNGQLQKGLGLWLVLIIFYALFYVLQYTGGEFIALFVIIIWIYGIYDAYMTSTNMNAGKIPYSETNIQHIIIFIIGSIILGYIIISIATAAFESSYYL
jgi:hypothetical protein